MQNLFSSATARAPGTRRTASPAGPTSISPNAARRSAEAGRLLQKGATSSTSRSRPCSSARSRRSGIALDDTRPAVDSRHQELEVERAPLRRAAGVEQGRNRREARRSAGQDLAAQLRHHAAAADAGRSAPPVPRPALPGADRRRSAADRIAEGDGRTLSPVLARDDRADDPVRPARRDRRARQQPARAGDVSGPISTSRRSSS